MFPWAKWPKVQELVWLEVRLSMVAVAPFAKLAVQLASWDQAPIARQDLSQAVLLVIARLERAPVLELARLAPRQRRLAQLALQRPLRPARLVLSRERKLAILASFRTTAFDASLFDQGRVYLFLTTPFNGTEQLYQ